MNIFYLICGIIIGVFLTLVGVKHHKINYPTVDTENVISTVEPVEPELRWYDDVSNDSRCYYLSTNTTNISCAYLVGGASK